MPDKVVAILEEFRDCGGDMDAVKVAAEPREIIIEDAKKLEIWSYSQETYELMHREGERRFGSACKHKQVKNGCCVKCLRQVVYRLKGGLR